MTKLDKSLSKGEYEIDFLPSLYDVTSEGDLKTLLMSLEQGLRASDLPPVYVLLLMNNLLERSDIYQLLTDETKAVGGRVWAQLKLSGFQLDMPPIFASAEEKNLSAT